MNNWRHLLCTFFRPFHIIILRLNNFSILCIRKYKKNVILVKNKSSVENETADVCYIPVNTITEIMQAWIIKVNFNKIKK